MRYKVVLTYNGADFCGWQSQPNGLSVQDAVEDAVKKLTGERVRVTGSGRTDAGVHALCQVAHFDINKDMAEKSIVGGLNAYLPRSVRVTTAQKADESFDARRSVKKKTYMYLMYTGYFTPLLSDRALNVPNDIDIKRMTAEAKKIEGTHDFACFMAAGSGAKTSVRTVYDAHFERDGRFIKFFITADGFLYNMVRIIAAQLIKAGCGGDVDIEKLIAARDRTVAKETAPPYALYLYNVEYANQD